MREYITFPPFTAEHLDELAAPPGRNHHLDPERERLRPRFLVNRRSYRAGVVVLHHARHQDPRSMKSRRHRLLVGGRRAPGRPRRRRGPGRGGGRAGPARARIGRHRPAIGLVARVPRPSRPHRATGRRADPTDADGDAETGLRWVMQWERVPRWTPCRSPATGWPGTGRLGYRGGGRRARPAGGHGAARRTRWSTPAPRSGSPSVSRAESVRIEAHDAAPDPPRQQPHDLWAARGRGLQLVDGLSRRWGWSPDANGKTVWADVSSGWPP